MYESPIEMIYGELQTQMMQEDEKLVMKAVRNVGVNVDKETLIKALQYDRNQYKKGYEDGKNDVLEKIKTDLEKEADTSNRLHGISEIGLRKALKIIDKYMAESEGI